MAKFEVRGMEEFIEICIFTDQKIHKVIGKTIYAGAKTMARYVSREIDNIPVDDNPVHTSMKTGLTTPQKEGLQESFGIARVRRGTYGYNVKLGFDGYNTVPSKTSRTGFQPNSLIARSSNKGTKFMKASHFMDKAVKKGTKSTIKRMDKVFNRELEKIWNK